VTPSSFRTRTDRLASLGLVGLGLVSGCAFRTAGLEASVTFVAEMPPELAHPRLTDLALVECPGAEHAAGHAHGTTVWSLPLGTDPAASAELALRPGRYCDLRVQLEADGAVPRQAVLPLSCDGHHAALTLDASSLGAPARILVVGGGELESPPAPEDPVAAQRWLDGTLAGLSVVVLGCVERDAGPTSDAGPVDAAAHMH